MTTQSLGRGITLTKDMYARMGKASESRSKSGERARVGDGRALRYSSERLDPRSHVRLT